MKNLLFTSRRIVLDFQQASLTSIAVEWVLLWLSTSARKRGGEVKLANLANHPKEGLQITKLVTIVELFDRAEDATAAFK